MRIIAGAFRGRALAALGKGDPGAHLRPTTDRTRESLFSILQGGRFGDPLGGARVLDLFAGTGALGLEALSRGADHACFVDDGRKAAELIRKNIAICGAGAVTRLIRRDACRLGSCDGAPFDLVFLDPPYGKALAPRALQAARAGGWIAPDALIVIEESGDIFLPDWCVSEDQRRFGDTTMHFIRAAE